MAMDPETRFERALLASARGDAEPHDVGAAWSRFAGALDRAAAGRDGEAPWNDAAAGPRGRVAGAGPAVASRRLLAYLLVGALGGAGITAVVAVRRSPLAVTPQVAPGPPPVDMGVASAPPPRVAPTVADEAAPSRARPATRRGISRRRSRGTSPSTLAAEVSRIDAARSANGIGAHDDATRLVDEYHAQFPAGLLAADADIVALEAAAGRGDDADVTRRAAVFLARYPRDPHAARVRRIAAEAALGPGHGAR